MSQTYASSVPARLRILAGCLRGLCLLLGLGYGQSVALGEDFYVQARHSNIYDTFIKNGYLVYNQGATTITLSTLAAGVHSTNPTVTATYATMVGTYDALYQNGWFAPYTILAGQTRWLPFDYKVRFASSSDIGTRTFTHAMTIKEDSGTPRVVTHVRTVLMSHGFTGAMTASAGAIPPTGTLFISPTVGSTTSEYMSWGTITVGTPAPLGRITIAGIQGNVSLNVRLNGAVVATAAYTGGADTDPHSNLVYSTTSPAAQIGKVCQLWVNGSMIPLGTVTADAYGNFDVLFNLQTAGPEGSPVVYDHALIIDGDPVPLTGDDQFTGTDPNHTRPANPGPIPGTDPKTDTTPDENMTVSDFYRATRAALEDTLGADNGNGPGFNFDQWKGTDSAANNIAGQNGGNAAGAGINGLTGGMGTRHLAAIPGGGDASGIPVHHLFAGTTAYISVNTYASTVRLLGLIATTIMFALGVVSIVRGAFAGS